MRRSLLIASFVLIASAVPAAAQDLDARFAALSPLEADEVLWLARCLYTESDRAHEQRLVAWVVRNRVETAYRGRTYRGVVLEDRQFSAFNEPTPRRAAVLAYDAQTTGSAWRQALGVALSVYQAPAAARPFGPTVRHFYSPVSMPGGRTPDWAVAAAPLDNDALGVDPHRFLFFEGVDEPRARAGEALAGPGAPAVRTVGTVRDLREAPDETTSAPRLAPRLRGSVGRPARPVVRRPARAGGGR